MNPLPKSKHGLYNFIRSDILQAFGTDGAFGRVAESGTGRTVQILIENDMVLASRRPLGGNARAEQGYCRLAEPDADVQYARIAADQQ